MGSPDPELPDTTLFVTVFSQNFEADISSLREYMYIKDIQAGISALREFVTVDEVGFSALRGERVNRGVIYNIRSQVTISYRWLCAVLLAIATSTSSHVGVV